MSGRGRRLGSLSARSRTYQAVGVSLAKADAIVERLRGAVESTGAAGFGAFAGLYPLDDRRLLAAPTVVVGLPSSGLHTNGFTLVRELVGDGDFDADLLLAPHRLYVDEVRALRERAEVKALAHVTGGGILGNLTRVLPDGVEPQIDWDS